MRLIEVKINATLLHLSKKKEISEMKRKLKEEMIRIARTILEIEVGRKCSGGTAGTLMRINQRGRGALLNDEEM